VADYAYRIVNVFADPEAPGKLTGNPLCVFEDARGLSDAAMQALALQFNLSETTFLLVSDKASAKVRIFTPAAELPFAGHPTLGSAHVVRALGKGGDAVSLEMKAGLIRVTARGDDWTLEANKPRTRAPATDAAQIARVLGIEARDIADVPLWVDTGSEQLVIPLASPEAVRRCRPDAEGMARTDLGRLYVWSQAGANNVLARFFMLKHGALGEDFGTGSAAANLGGWFVAQKGPLPVSCVIQQGEPIGRPARLRLDVDREQRIFVGGRVIELARGSLSL
jgi:trans-2,3-dihydro-3-hydroxyanthranilate isomerase